MEDILNSTMTNKKNVKDNLVDLISKIGEKISLSNIIHQTENYFVPKKTKNISWNSPDVKHLINTKFHGYIRDDGKVGTENNWLVIPLVFCQNRNIDVLKKNMIKSLGFERGSDDTYDLSELINKYRSGASISELSNISLQKKTNSKKTNSLFNFNFFFHFFFIFSLALLC